MTDTWVPADVAAAAATTAPPPPPPPLPPPPETGPPPEQAPPPSDTWVPQDVAAAPAAQAPAPQGGDYVAGQGDVRSQTGDVAPVDVPPAPPDQHVDTQTTTPEGYVVDTGQTVEQRDATEAQRVAEIAKRTAAVDSGQTTPPPPAPPPADAGPLQQAANALGALVAPVTAQLPQPVQNLTNIVGQPVGGTIDAVQSVANELGQGDIPGAVGAGLGALSGPWSRGVEQTGANIAAGQPAIPTIDQILANPANLLAVPSGVASRYGPASAVTGTTEEAWFASLPPDQQASLAAQGGVAMNQAWLDSIGAGPTPPPQVSNPLDAATSGNPLERGLQVASAIPQFLGGWAESAKQGTLPPFLLSQAQNIVEDPLTFIPGVLGERALTRGGELARRVPIVDKLTSLAPAEEARLASERLGTATEEYTRAGISQLPTAGWPPGEGPPPGVNRVTSPRPAPVTELGTFVTPDRPVSAATPGVVLQAESPVRNPFTMDATQFHTSYANPQAPATMADIRALKADLIRQGYDGIALTDPTGMVQQVASFPSINNVPAQQAVKAAYSTAPPGFQKGVTEAMPPNPNFYRGVTASKDTITLMKEPAMGRFNFRNGEKPTHMTVADVVAKTNEDQHVWLRGFERDGTPKDWTQAEDKAGRAWRSLNTKFDPNGTENPVSMMAGLDNPGARVSAAQIREDHLVRVLDDAVKKGLPVTKRGQAMGAFGQWTNAIRQSMLFNVLNVPRYIAQNLTTNTINIAVRGGGLRPAIDVWTNVKEMGRIFGHQKDNAPTTLNSVIKHTGMGERPNMLMTQRPYFDALTGEMPKWLKIPTDIVAPEYGRFVASVPDIHARHAVGLNAIQDGYHELNKTVAPTVYDQLRRQVPSQMPSEAKVHQVVMDFFDQNRTIPDASTGKTLTGLTGRPAKFEPMWNPDDLRTHLKEHLYEDVPANQRPYAGQINRVVNDLTGMMRDGVRKIGDTAEETVDNALFSWRNSVLDEGLSNVSLFHYYMSRQGGFYASEAIKHPWVASAYGRMMAEMEQQNEQIGGPAWLNGWFQFQQSVAGFSTFFSPFDNVGSLLTFADWQMQGDPNAFRDLTWLGKGMLQFPFFVHPLITGVASSLGILGPDYPTPSLTGTETFAAKAIELLNLANAEGAPFMKPFNAMGIGVDANGDPLPLAPRPLQDLYASVGNALSTAMEPITGLAPINVTPSWATFTRDVQTIGEQETRKAHPEWDTHTDAGEMAIFSHVNEVMNDPGSDEYRAWYKLAASEPYQLGAGVPPFLAGLLRIASPIGVKTMPEQRALDTMKGLQESGNAPMRTANEAAPQGVSSDVYDTMKYGSSDTLEGRVLEQQRYEFEQLVPADLRAARTVLSQVNHFDFPDGSSPEIGGVTYTNEELQAKTSSERYALGQQYLSEQGFSDEQNQGYYDDQNAYLADHPDLAGYKAYVDLVQQAEASNPDNPDAGVTQFAQEMASVNPSFGQWARGLIDPATGQVKVNPDTGKSAIGAVFGADAYLAAQGVRPSVYSSLAGNNPSTAPGGYPAIPGVAPGQPLLPSAELATNATEPTLLYSAPGDITWNEKAGHESIATVLPDLPIQTLGLPKTITHTYNGVTTTYDMVQVALQGQPDRPIGWVDSAQLANTSPTKPIGTGTVVQPSGGLAALAGGAVGSLGAAKDAVGNPLDALGGVAGAIGSTIETAQGVVQGTMVGDQSNPTKPAVTTPKGIGGTGAYDVVPAKDGMGIQSTEAGTDRTWMETMMDGHAKVNTDYKSPAPIDSTTGAPVWYGYQIGHGAIDGEHAAYDIGCDTPEKGCAGTPIKSPVSGKVVCAGYGQGTGEALNSAGAANSYGCTYSQGTTNANNDGSPPAHTVTIDVGTDPQGNHLQLSFNHMGTSDLTPGQQIQVGDLIGGMGNTDGGPHTHLEAWGYSPELGTYKILDPALVVGGYYTTHSVDDESTTPG